MAPVLLSTWSNPPQHPPPLWPPLPPGSYSCTSKGLNRQVCWNHAKEPQVLFIWEHKAVDVSPVPRKRCPPDFLLQWRPACPQKTPQTRTGVSTGHRAPAAAGGCNSLSLTCPGANFERLAHKDTSLGESLINIMSRCSFNVV